MSSSSTLTSTRGRPTGGSNNNNNNGGSGNSTFDTFMGTNVYLYGFLSTLILIFLVSIAVAYKGYRTRALLRQRIDEALAAGVFIPGLSPEDGPGGRRRRDVGEKPVMSEVWLRRRKWDTNVGKWDQLQPLSLQPARQPSSNSEPPTPPTLEEWAAQHPFERNPRSLFSFRNRRARPTQQPPSNDNPLRIVGNPVTSIPVPSDGIRQPPTPTLPATSASSVPQSLRGQPYPLAASQPNLSANPEQQQVVDVPLLLGVVIAMPNPSRPHSRSSSYPHPHRSSMISTKGKERESESSHNHSHEDENESGELPELVLGYADVPLVVRRPPPGSTVISESAPATPSLQAFRQPSRVPSLRALGSSTAAVSGS